jgi:hypothetical protein
MKLHEQRKYHKRKSEAFQKDYINTYFPRAVFDFIRTTTLSFTNRTSWLKYIVSMLNLHFFRTFSTSCNSFQATKWQTSHRVKHYMVAFNCRYCAWRTKT